ncbi:hypothetical protein RJ639_006966 [Escallonia herrerae]|uniref:RING-type domain-containing protein n=1 Tax=Escallonia herrerae TaxID=1293975 RepID=A0AA89AZK2_9ASTE|nr:hypothetical protein RJ639_006966 [Escallonia herrerae]
MFGGNTYNTAVPVSLDENCLQYPANTSNPLQLFENGDFVNLDISKLYNSLQLGFNVDPFFGGEHNSSIFRPNKRGRESENLSRQISLNHDIYYDEADRPASIPNQNPVSTGLRLSYDDDERNSSVTSASGSMTASPSIILSLGDNIKTELGRQKDELDHYIRTQEQDLLKGVRDIKQRHMVSFLTAIEKGVGKKLREKDLEIENINRKNRELFDRIKHVATEAQNWQYRAKYNESVVNILKTNLRQALSLGADQGKEGFGDTDIDDAASSIDPINYLNMPGGSGKSAAIKDNMICRACKAKEVSILLMPCRHLCLCIDCEGLVSICPVCQLMKTASVQVYLY